MFRQQDEASYFGICSPMTHDFKKILCVTEVTQQKHVKLLFRNVRSLLSKYEPVLGAKLGAELLILHNGVTTISMIFL